jgi:transposase-like protein
MNIKSLPFKREYSRAEKRCCWVDQDSVTINKWNLPDCPHCNSSMSVEKAFVRGTGYTQVAWVCRNCYRMPNGERFKRMPVPVYG